MQIQFDPRDRSACGNVLAAVYALHGHIPLRHFMAFPESPDPTAACEFPDEVEPPAAAANVLAGIPDEVDAAAAFGADTPAERQFSKMQVGEPAYIVLDVDGSRSERAETVDVPAPASGVELDADGLPWDGRIHSGPADTKPKNADGRWRSKRGASGDLVAQVTAELRQVMGAPTPAPTQAAAPTPPPPVATAPIPAPPAPPPTPPVAVTEFGQAGAETAASPPAPPTATNFAGLMKVITARQTAGTLTIVQVKATAEMLGLNGVADLLKRPDLIGAYEAALPEPGQAQ